MTQPTELNVVAGVDFNFASNIAFFLFHAIIAALRFIPTGASPTPRTPSNLYLIHLMAREDD